MTEKKITLGQAIDRIIEALDPLDTDTRRTAIEAACAHLGIGLGKNALEGTRVAPATGVSIVGTSSPAVTSVGQPAKTDIRSLKDQKNPRSARQMACVVAYYLKEVAPEGERKDSVNAKDLEKYFKQAKFKLPKKITQILPDAKQSGYFEAASGKGEYSLNAVGYNLVAHNLPGGKGE